MAELTWNQNLHTAGSWTVQANHPAALAAVPDAIVQQCGLGADGTSCWALHPDEQAGGKLEAYRDERNELGHGAVVEVYENLRPRQANVVWIDRFHLLAMNGPASSASRLLGLNVGSKGSIVVYVHDAGAAPAVQQFLAGAPNAGIQHWDQPALVSQTRFAVRYEGPALHAQLVAAPYLAPAVGTALEQLRQLVISW